MDLQKLLIFTYRHEINIQINWFWDGDVDIKIGDENNGYEAEATIEIEKLTEWLFSNLKRIYPTLHWEEVI
jgi:hypothetical protein